MGKGIWTQILWRHRNNFSGCRSVPGLSNNHHTGQTALSFFCLKTLWNDHSLSEGEHCWFLQKGGLCTTTTQPPARPVTAPSGTDFVCAGLAVHLMPISHRVFSFMLFLGLSTLIYLP